MKIKKILERLQNEHSRTFGSDFSEFQKLIKAFGKTLPFIGAILTESQGYCGRIEKLKLKDDKIRFVIVDCDENGKSDKNSKVYKRKLVWKSLKGIEVQKDREGKPLFEDDLLKRHITEEEKNARFIMPFRLFSKKKRAQ